MNRIVRYITLFALLCTAVNASFAATTTVKGTDNTYIGTTLYLQTWDDGWQATHTLLDSCTVDANGNFQFTFELTETRKAHIPLGHYTGSLFLEPGKTYEIALPINTPISAKEAINPYFQAEELLVSFTNLSSTDINRQIIDFEDAFDRYWEQLLQEPIVTPQLIEQAIASLDSIFPASDHAFWEQYKTYRYALMVNLYAAGAPDLSISNYFLQNPVLYHQPAYWEAFDAIFPHFDRISGLYSNQPLFELAIMQKVESNDLPLSKLDYIQTTENKKIADAIRLKKLSQKVGHHIAIDSLTNINGETIHWNELQFPKAYFLFTNSQLNECRADVAFVEKMSKKYPNKCLFLLIFTDESTASIEQACHGLKNNYFVCSLQQNPMLRTLFYQTYAPAYYLLDSESRLMQVPAPEPKNFVP